jgi:5-deoxy-glucuronate isomerase
MATVFTSVGTDNGRNTLTENPCRLLDFELLILEDGQRHEFSTGNREIVAVLLGGKATFEVGLRTFREVGERATVFDGPPYALCSAPSDLAGEPYLITPEHVTSGTWGKLNFTRYYNQILTEAGQPDLPARRLIVGETFTPGGNWSTYPAHEHEIDNLPDEAYHEEMYFFRVSPGDGFGITRNYHDDADAVNYTVRNNTILMMPDGYHTYVAAPGFNAYYLWFLAGEHRQQAVTQDAVQEREVNKL